MIFFYLSEGMESCKMSGKIREKSGNFKVDDKWQPCDRSDMTIAVYRGCKATKQHHTKCRSNLNLDGKVNC